MQPTPGPQPLPPPEMVDAAIARTHGFIRLNNERIKHLSSIIVYATPPDQAGVTGELEPDQGILTTVLPQPVCDAIAGLAHCWLREVLDLNEQHQINVKAYQDLLIQSKSAASGLVVPQLGVRRRQ
jgi:hypothetical protein